MKNKLFLLLAFLLVIEGNLFAKKIEVQKLKSEENFLKKIYYLKPIICILHSLIQNFYVKIKS